MTFLALLKRVIERRPEAPRWPYIVLGLAALLVSVLSVGVAFDRVRGLYLAILVLCILQMVLPTVLGWLLVLAPFFAYGISAVVRPIYGQWVPYMLLGFVPAVVLWIGRPWARGAAKHRAGIERR